jgi:hypothetical protein
MATTQTSPVLDIRTVVTRPTIRIDGTLYELRSRDEVPWLLYRGYADTFRRCSALLTKGKLTDDEERELETQLPALIEAFVIAPKSVLRKLDTEARYQIATVFSLLLLKTTTAPTAGAKRARNTAARKASSTRTGPK